ncbi:MAG: type II toxin-antitoxin system PemK/MazF family toxin [Gammaproteobacteria bacterium]|nr:type II toxin-antitoxin system PemK/MazF family toxin [Gammaproteobacteria bacterium]MDE2261698.1 type II toxin-antitoxin system PemK/MazF family toxin [Gammaproteobacteria bacterium]
MVIEQAEIWWADLDEPVGSGPGFRRPVLVVQGNALNRSRISTVVCVPLTSNLKWEGAPGNVLLPKTETGLPEDSVANVSLIIALDKQLLTDRVRKVPRRRFDLVLSGIDTVLGR